MKIWFDLSNSPHINLFSGLIAELKSDGHETVITCRPLANTIDLLRLEKIEFSVVGEHYGKNIIKKALGFPIRVVQLHERLASEYVDVAISQSSFHSPITSRLLRVPSIYMNDNEHALGNIPAFLAAKRILIPEFLSLEKVTRHGARRSKIRQYPGVKEGIYLWRLAERLDAMPPALSKNRPSVYIRPEPWTAQYYRGRTNFLDDVILKLRNEANVNVLPRGRDQGLHYKEKKFDGITVVDGAISMETIARDCDFFIGAGGTMTREMAVLGIPTVSVYQDELLDVDRHLLNVGSFVHEPDLTADLALSHLRQAIRKGRQRELLDKGRLAYNLIKEELLGLRTA